MDIPVQEQQQRHGYVANEVIVRLKRGVGRSVINTIGAAHGVVIIEEMSQLNAYRLRVPHSVDAERAMRAYGQHPDVEYATPNYNERASGVGNPAYPQ